jgi:hypothetical protein
MRMRQAGYAALALGLGMALGFALGFASAPRPPAVAATAAPVSPTTPPDAAPALPAAPAANPSPSRRESRRHEASAPRPTAVKPVSALAAAGFLLPARPTVPRDWVPPSAPVALGTEAQLLQRAAELESQVLRDDVFDPAEAMGALDPAGFETLVAALEAQAHQDPGAEALARDFRTRMERQYREDHGPGRVDRIVCGLRLCVTQETTVGDGRTVSLGIGVGRSWAQPDGTTVHRSVYVVEPGIAYRTAFDG